MSKMDFIIHHTAASVKYSVIGFREKNKDEITSNVVELIKDTKNKTFYNIFFQV